MIYIDTNQVRKAASYDEWIDAMEQALTLREDADFIMPQRSHIDFGDNTLLLMPCITKEYISTKLVSMFPGNAAKGIAPISGTVVLANGKTGQPVATIEGAALTAMRTAAVGSVAVRHLSPADVKNLGIVGAGTQGLHQALFACSQRNIDKLFVSDNNPGTISKFSDQFSKLYPAIEVIHSDNTVEMVGNCDIIITATSSREPVLPDIAGLYENKLIVGIGSYKPDMREFPDEVFRSASGIFIDTIHGKSESGDLIYPVEKGFLNEENLIPAGELLKRKPVTECTRVYKSVGMALFDNAGAKLVYEKKN